MKTLFKFFFFLIACLSSGFVLANDLIKANDLYKKGQVKEALTIYLKPEYQKNPIIQNRLGNIYLQPEFRDEKKSTAWFKKAAEQGNADAQYNLGLAYQDGIGIEKDYEKAMLFYKKAANQNVPEAMNNIGILYDKGLGVKKDEAEALKWYMKGSNEGGANAKCNAAESLMYGKSIKRNYESAHTLLEGCLRDYPNNGCCLVRLSELYADGWGVPEDKIKAHELREKAAASGSDIAMYMLGRDFDYGIGVGKDPKAAIDWYMKAAEKDHAKAMHRLYEVYEHGKLGQPVDKVKAAEWKARAEKAMKNQGVSRNAWVDAFRLLMED